MVKHIQYTFCSACGKPYGDLTVWPRMCVRTDHDGCGQPQWNTPNPIGVLLQTVTDGTRTGILTPIRGHAPQIGSPGLVGGFQEDMDDGGDDAAMREYLEEMHRRMDGAREDLDIILSRGSGPAEPGRRQTLLFSVNPVSIHVDAFADFEPDAETQAIDFSWGPRVLAFPTHTHALALYFRRYQGVEAPAAHFDQPRTRDALIGVPGSGAVANVPYEQPLLDRGLWMVEHASGELPVAVRRDGDAWRADS